MTWKGVRFQIQECTLNLGLHCIMLRRDDQRERLLEALLDTMANALQVYDSSGRIQYMNRSCKRLLDISLEENLEGRHLLDVFAVDPDFSSTLTALRTRSLVQDRFDQYKSTTGKELSTVTTAIPVIENDRLLGAVTIERDIQMTEKNMSVLRQDQRMLTRHLSTSIKMSPDIRYSLKNLVGSSPGLLDAIDLAKRMAPRDNNILIQGETGTGKEIFAQGIQALSSRRNEKFVAVNCAAFPESLIESMMFGTVRGAFTGSTDKIGLMEEANHGTLFLDELNSMSLGMQAKLLRVLQEKNLQRVGGTKNIPIDIRVIASCNEDVFQLTETGKLRRDLFYRLASIIVEIPPLRERMEDLDELVWNYIHTHEPLCSQLITQITPAFWRRLQQHAWPGNIRELFHILNYAVSVSENGILRETDLPSYFKNLGQSVSPAAARSAPAPADMGQIPFQKGLAPLLRDYECRVLRDAYLTCGKNATKAAELLKISRQNFQYYVKKYNLKD